MNKIHKMTTKHIVSLYKDKTICNLIGMDIRNSNSIAYYDLDNFLLFCKRYPESICKVCMNNISNLIFQ